jgi:hypothetical protein
LNLKIFLTLIRSIWNKIVLKTVSAAGLAGGKPREGALLKIWMNFTGNILPRIKLYIFAG